MQRIPAAAMRVCDTIARKRSSYPPPEATLPTKWAMPRKDEPKMTTPTTTKQEPKNKLKRARGALLRAIWSGRMEPPPGYMGIKEMEQLPAYRATAASVKQR
jgi:hypothetical protein